MSYRQIQKQIDMGLGFAAKELGTPHKVYRINETSSGNVIAPENLIASNVKAFTKIAYGGGVRESFESEKSQAIMWYRVIADLRKYLVGDIFVLDDPIYGAGHSSVPFEQDDQFKAFAIADHSPLKKALAGRITCEVTMFRPLKGPDNKGRFDRTQNSAKPVVLNNGVFELGEADALPCKIPAGLIAQGRTYGERAWEDVPAEKRRSGWMLYMPALNGVIGREGDIIVGPDDAKYRLVIPFTQLVGASGAQWFLEREAPGGDT